MSWLELRLASEILDDYEGARIAANNRVTNQLLDGPLYEAGFDLARRLEVVWRENLLQLYQRTVPTSLQAWAVATRGVGHPALARLLGVLGDPLVAEPYTWTDVPPPGHVCGGCGKTRHLVALAPHQRTFPELRAYCGHGRPGRRSRGMLPQALAALGNPLAKSRLHQLAANCLPHQKCKGCRDGTPPTEPWRASVGCVDCGEYRQAYVVRRVQTVGRWPAGHAHEDAIRIAAKAMLGDIYDVRRGALTPGP